MLYSRYPQLQAALEVKPAESLGFSSSKPVKVNDNI